ncbi:MAG: hypothetical protein H7841_04180 [Magnetospirillum sp. WYHS-4]
MAEYDPKTSYATEEQLAYATVLDWGMKAGFAILVVSFLLYVTGILPAHVPVDHLPEYWNLPVGKYMEKAGVHGGWTWVGLLHKGDFLNFAGIAFLSAVTIGCYFRILPMLFAKKDRIYGIIAVGQVLILVLGASGILAAGH